MLALRTLNAPKHETKPDECSAQKQASQWFTEHCGKANEEVSAVPAARATVSGKLLERREEHHPDARGDAHSREHLTNQTEQALNHGG
jgi:hypothetical protein